MAKTTTTIQGDTFDILAKRLFDDETQMSALIAANIEHRKVVIFPAGIVLNVPEIDTDTITISDNLPPWKK